MAALHVHDVPDEMYGRIKSLAATNNRTVDAEVMSPLERALQDEAPSVSEDEASFDPEALDGWKRHFEALEDIRRRRRFFPKTEGMPDSTELLREDRAR